MTSPRGHLLVDAPLVRTRLDREGILAPPPGVAGWYAESGWPKPGFPGASILAGHINTRRNGPDTFARLPEVRPSAVVTVRYSSGDEVDFVVTRSKALPKTQTPKDDTIWDAANPRPLLRLITCDGVPEGTVRSRLHYATGAMRAVLEADARPTLVAQGGRTA